MTNATNVHQSGIVSSCYSAIRPAWPASERCCLLTAPRYRCLYALPRYAQPNEARIGLAPRRLTARAVGIPAANRVGYPADAAPISTANSFNFSNLDLWPTAQCLHRLQANQTTRQIGETSAAHPGAPACAGRQPHPHQSREPETRTWRYPNQSWQSRPRMVLQMKFTTTSSWHTDAERSRPHHHLNRAGDTVQQVARCRVLFAIWLRSGSRYQPVSPIHRRREQRMCHTVRSPCRWRSRCRYPRHAAELWPA